MWRFDASKVPGGKPAVSDAEIQAYYAAHQAEYKTEEEVKTRHILITSKAGADAQTDSAAKAKAQDVLKQLQAGGNFADLAKKYSDDPGSKDQGGELPLIPTASLDPAYAKAAMALNPGQTSGLVKSAFGYHIIQTEQKQPAGVKPLAEVKDSIVQVLQQQKAGAAEQAFAAQLATEAKKDGLEKTAAAHGLHAVTTDYIGKDGTIGGLSDASALLAQAFTTDKGAAPATVSTGDGYAVFQVVDVKAAHAPDFAEYKSHILDDYRDQKVPQLVQQETDQAGRPRQGAERPEEGRGGVEGPGEVERPGGRGWAGAGPGRDERAGVGGLLAGQGGHLRADQRGTDRRGADRDRQTAADRRPRSRRTWTRPANSC